MEKRKNTDINNVVKRVLVAVSQATVVTVIVMLFVGLISSAMTNMRQPLEVNRPVTTFIEPIVVTEVPNIYVNLPIKDCVDEDPNVIVEIIKPKPKKVMVKVIKPLPQNIPQVTNMTVLPEVCIEAIRTENDRSLTEIKGMLQQRIAQLESNSQRIRPILSAGV
jgi:hypothetical protein